MVGPEGVHDLEAQTEWLQGLSVGDVQFDAAADLTRPLLELGPKPGWAERDARQVESSQPGSNALGVGPRCADQVEGPGRAAPLGQGGCLDEAQAGIDGGGLQGRHVGRRRHPGQDGSIPPRGSTPVGALHDREPQFRVSLALQEQRDLTQGEPVAYRCGNLSDEALETGLHGTAFAQHATDGVRSVQHHDLAAVIAAGDHHGVHGSGESVVAGTDVRQVHHHRVHAVEIVSGRLQTGRVVTVE
jgi:hypothetical protein